MKAKQLLLVGNTLYESKKYKGDEAESCNKCALKKECDKDPEWGCPSGPDENYIESKYKLVER